MNESSYRLRMFGGYLQYRKPSRKLGSQCACGAYCKDGDCSWDYWTDCKDLTMQGKVMFSDEQIEEARQELTKAAMLWAAVNIDDGGALTGVDVPDRDCIVYLNEQAMGIELDIKKYLGA